MTRKPREVGVDTLLAKVVKRTAERARKIDARVNELIEIARRQKVTLIALLAYTSIEHLLISALAAGNEPQ
jgi:hypothetical protein